LATPAFAGLPVTVIRPERRWSLPRFRELWAYRELLYFLVWADVKVRYKQTALGAAWAIIQPFLTMVVFSIFFGRLAGIPSDGVPYPVFAYSALVPWTFFATALGTASLSLVEFRHVVTKVYFPRLVVPAAAVLAGLVDLGIAATVLAGLMFYYGLVPGLAVLTLPFFVLLAVLTACACSVWLAALNVQYRDVRYAIPFLVQAWLFATPVAYPSSLVPEQWRALYGLNPMAGVIEGFRWALFDGAPAPGPMLAVSALVTLLLGISGLIYFNHVERSLADVV
jgi:lipopolysaccharide transport system permease protein